MPIAPAAVHHDAGGRQRPEIHGACASSSPSCRTRSTPKLAIKIADLVKEGKLGGHRRHPDEDLGPHGQRLVSVLKRDAVAKVVPEQPRQAHPAAGELRANMLAIVDGVPHAADRRIHLALDRAPIELIVRRTEFRWRRRERIPHFSAVM